MMAEAERTVIRRLQAKVQQLEAANAELLAALEFYAAEGNWEVDLMPSGDCGGRARAAIAKRGGTP